MGSCLNTWFPVGGGAWEGCETFGRWTWLEQVDLWWLGTEAHSQADLASYLSWSGEMWASSLTLLLPQPAATLPSPPWESAPSIHDPQLLLVRCLVITMKKVTSATPEKYDFERSYRDCFCLKPDLCLSDTDCNPQGKKRESIHNGETGVFEGKRFFLLKYLLCAIWLN